MSDTSNNQNGVAKSWKTQVSAHRDFIMRDLGRSYNFPIPTEAERKNFRVGYGAKFTDYWIADAVAYALADHMGKRAVQDGLNEIKVPTGWTMDTSHEQAHIAFNCGRAANKLDVYGHFDVAQKYAEALSQGKAPDFSDKIQYFFNADFKNIHGLEVTGEAIFAQAKTDMIREGEGHFFDHGPSL